MALPDRSQSGISEHESSRNLRPYLRRCPQSGRLCTFARSCRATRGGRARFRLRQRRASCRARLHQHSRRGLPHWRGLRGEGDRPRAGIEDAAELPRAMGPCHDQRSRGIRTHRACRGRRLRAGRGPDHRCARQRHRPGQPPVCWEDSGRGVSAGCRGRDRRRLLPRNGGGGDPRGHPDPQRFPLPARRRLGSRPCGLRDPARKGGRVLPSHFARGAQEPGGRGRRTVPEDPRVGRRGWATPRLPQPQPRVLGTHRHLRRGGAARQLRRGDRCLRATGRRRKDNLHLGGRELARKEVRPGRVLLRGRHGRRGHGRRGLGIDSCRPFQALRGAEGPPPRRRGDRAGRRHCRLLQPLRQRRGLVPRGPRRW